MKWTDNKKKRPKVRVQRTFQGTMMEITAGFMVLSMWIVYLTIGARDSYLTGFSGTVVTIALLIGAYFPSQCINMPIEITNERQLSIMTLMSRAVAIEMPLVWMGIPMQGQTGSMLATTGQLFVWGGMAIVVATVAFFTWKARQAR